MKAALGPEVHVFLSDIETDVWEKGTVERLSEQSGRWLITRGEKGAEEVNRQKSTHLPPHKVRFCPWAYHSLASRLPINDRLMCGESHQPFQSQRLKGSCREDLVAL